MIRQDRPAAGIHSCRLIALVIGVVLCLPMYAAGSVYLPIYIGDSHGGTFSFLVKEFPHGASCTFLLFDAHDDATAIYRSDTIRKALRVSETDGTRDRLLDVWRRRGLIQCYNWLEPLMPGRIARVVWTAGEQLDRRRIAALAETAQGRLDMFEEVEPRDSGPLGSSFRVSDLKGLPGEPWLKRGVGKIIASIDLDFFADVPDDCLADSFMRVWQTVLKIPDLCAVSFAVSTPWQRDKSHAEILTCMALEAAASIANSRITFEPFGDIGPDRSNKAKYLADAGRVPPKLDLETASPRLRTLLVSLRKRLKVEFEPERLNTLMDRWAADPLLPQIVPAGRSIDPDGRLHIGNNQQIRIDLRNPGGGHIRWYALVPGAKKFNVFGEGHGFAELALRQIFRVRRPIGEGASIDMKAIRRVLDPHTRTGTAIVFAEVERDGDIWRSNDLEIAVRDSSLTGFRASLSELFARPYVFGAALLRSGEASGPNLARGADCSTFLIDGLRRTGRLLHWTDAAGFFRQLEQTGECRDFSAGSAVPMTPDEIETGFFVFLGRHIAAVWEDRPPLGILSSEDLLAHQLEGFPELIPLKEIMNRRKGFKTARLPRNDDHIRLVFGGDVMLGRKVGERITGVAFDPFAEIRTLLRDADLSFVTLESLPASIGTASPGLRYVFRAPVAAAGLLADAGLDGVSLAHNHALDCGETGLRDGIRRLENAGIRAIGTIAAGVEAVRYTRKGVPFSVFGYAAFPAGGAVCDDLASLQKAIRAEQGRSFPIVLVHWGEEHNPNVTDCQREIAKALISAGAKLIVGSGPHVTQKLSVLNEVPIAWSLGNLVFDGPGPDAGWSGGILLEVEISRAARCVKAACRYVSLGDDGKPGFHE